MTLAQHTVDLLLEMEADDFINDFATKWRAVPLPRTDDWLQVQWYKGMDRVGGPQEVATGDDHAWVEWMTNYANWLDDPRRWPFTDSGTDHSVSLWFEGARMEGWQAKYRKTPNGRRLPPAPVRRQ